MKASASSQASRQAFWTDYQPGFQLSEAPVGTGDFYREVERRRYALEPGILEMARFGEWSGKDVLEMGCGMATDGMQFIRAGARYTGMDFSPTAIELARERVARAGHEATFVHGSIADPPFEDASFDLVYSMGVIHHLPETQRVVQHMHRLLRPGGTAIVMVYHRDSLNFYVSIMVLRRLLAGLLLVPGSDRALSAVTGEPLDVMRGHRDLFREHGLRYLSDPGLFLSNNTDGPGNPLSKVYTRRSGAALFRRFADVRTDVRFLNLRAYPGGERLATTRIARRLDTRLGWHLWITARKAG